MLVGSLPVTTAGPVDTVVVVPVGGARDRYFCFISSAVKGAPVLRIPEPAELSEPVLESDEALLAAGGAWLSAWEVRLQRATILQTTDVINAAGT